MKKIIMIVLIAAAVVGVFALSNTLKEEPAAEVTATTEVPEQETEEIEEPNDGPVNPLTGLEVSEEISQNRPYAVMVNNLKAALPQQGVGSADIIYEVPVEGGITRMLAVFQDISDVGTIGSVRSVRPYYLDLVQGLDGILIHAGGSDQAYSDIWSRGIDNVDGVNGSGEIFFRDPDRKAQGLDTEHTMVTTSELIAEYLPTYNIGLQHEEDYTYEIAFLDSGTRSGGASAKTIQVVFSTYKTGVFEYSEDDGEYYVSQHGDEYIDGNTDEQVSVKNVLVLFANITGVPGDTAGRLQAELIGSGSGYFICDGEYFPITWTKDGYTSQFVYTMEDGSAVAFGRGTSYVNIVATGADVTFE